MPLENLVGNKFISDLNPNWPAGTDLPDAGDDHLRGIKNVLQKTFPNLNGPVNLTDEDLNRGSVPAGSVMPFYMSASPRRSDSGSSPRTPLEVGLVVLTTRP
jgi:hypothetical protein